MVRPKMKPKRGRPYAGGRDPIVSVRLDPETRERIEEWGRKGDLKLSEAVRQLIQRGLARQ